MFVFVMVTQQRFIINTPWMRRNFAERCKLLEISLLINLITENVN